MQPESVIHNVTEEEVLAKYESRIRAWARRMDYSLQEDLAQAARLDLVRVWRAKGDGANDAYLRSTIIGAMKKMMTGEYLRRRTVMNAEMLPPDLPVSDSAEASVELDEALRPYNPLEIDIAMASGGGWGVHDIARMFRMRTDRVRAALKKIRGSSVAEE